MNIYIYIYSPIGLTACLWTVGGNPLRHGQNIKLHTERTLVAQPTLLPTMPPCCPVTLHTVTLYLLILKYI